MGEKESDLRLKEAASSLKMSEAHSSISKGSLVLKVLIDKKEYESLLRAKAFQDKYENKLKEHYILKPQNDEDENKEEQIVDEEEKRKATGGQIGEGSVASRFEHPGSALFV